MNAWDYSAAEIIDPTPFLRSNDGRVATLQSSWTEWRGYRFWVAAYGDRGTAWAYYAPMLGLVVTLDGPGGKSKRRVQLYPRVNLAEKAGGGGP